MGEVLPKEFFNRDAEIVARELLGNFLVVKQDGEIAKLVIIETESYLGPHDLASHSSKGRTKRTEVMYEEAGTIYMYLIYGMYWMLNIVTGEKDYPAAVLIRGAGEYDGPGKLTRALHLDARYNGKQLSKATGIWVEKGGQPKNILATPRIGVDYSGEWKDKLLRFVLKD